jgi:hypothetical protein
MATMAMIRDAMHRAPFRGFTVRLSDGRHFIISHPDFVSVSPLPQSRDLVIHDEQGMHRIDLIHVVEVSESDPGLASAAEKAVEDNGK